MPDPLAADDYILGTGDEEVARLELQHAVWRPRATDAWRRAGFGPGQHLVDVGCGPGYATLDLAAVAGPAGRVTAFDRSPRFLGVLRHRLAALGVGTVEPTLLDLDAADLPALGADGAWCRWVLSFVREPRRVLAGIRAMLRPGGALVLHEYFGYAAWRLTPRSPELEEFVAGVMRSWRESGGEPDIALPLIPWLADDGFEVIETRAFVDVVSPQDFVWAWPAAFVESGARRLAELGYVGAERAAAMADAVRSAALLPHARMVTPGVMEVVARRV